MLDAIGTVWVAPIGKSYTPASRRSVANDLDVSSSASTASIRSRDRASLDFTYGILYGGNEWICVSVEVRDSFSCYRQDGRQSAACAPTLQRTILVIRKEPLTPNLKQFSAAKQRRLDALLDKYAEGTISAGEKAELEGLVAEAERLMIANAKHLAAFAADENGHAQSAAAPVTVWVKPDHVAT